MKKLFVLITFLSAANFITLAQESDDLKLQTFMTIEEINSLKSDNPEEYKFLLFAFDNGWYLTDFPKQKEDHIKDQFKELKLQTTESINIFTLGLEIHDTDYQYFRINNGDKMLVIRSKNHIQELMNKK